MNLFRSFKHRNFKLFVSGQLFSLFGIWMQGTAVSWLVWRLTASPKWLGAIGFATQIPILVLGLLGGVVADRVSRHKLVIAVQFTAMVQAGTLAGLTAADVISAPIVFMLAIFLGVVFAFDYPARQTFLMDMVGHEDIGNAVAINSVMVHGARVLGPVAAGLLTARFGEEACFAVNTVSFLFVLAALFAMKKEEFFPQVFENNTSVVGSIKEGLNFVVHERRIRGPLILMAVLSFFAMPYVFFLPQVVGERFGGSARELGIAMSVAGVGALIGAAYMASRKGIEGLNGIIKGCLFLAGLGIVGVSFLRSFWMVLSALFLTGATAFLVVVGTQTILQVLSPPDGRGRLMSVFTITFFGLAPVGSLIAGNLSSYLGVSLTLGLFGAACMLAAALSAVTSNKNI